MAAFEIAVAVRGPVGDRPKEYAATKIARLEKLARRPILLARIKLSEEQNPSLARPAIAEASLDVSGRAVRARVAARRIYEAIDLLERRLRRQLEMLAEHAQERRHLTAMPGPNEWRHGSLPSERPHYFPRPPEDREVMNQPTLATEPMSAEEAAFEMEMLDDDFLLFEDAETGADTVVHRALDGVVAVVRAGASQAGAAAPPTLDVASALERLDIAGEPFLFFVDPSTGRGTVVYHRYDGHYGLVTPAPSPR